MTFSKMRSNSVGYDILMVLSDCGFAYYAPFDSYSFEKLANAVSVARGNKYVYNRRVCEWCLELVRRGFLEHGKVALYLNRAQEIGTLRVTQAGRDLISDRLVLREIEGDGQCDQ